MNLKQKRTATWFLFVLLSWLFYKYAIAGTIELRDDCEALRHRIDSSDIQKIELQELEIEVAGFHADAGATEFVTHEQLLDIITNYCPEHGLTLKDFPEELRFNREEWNTEIHELTVSGSYVEIVQFIEHLHRLHKGKIVSTAFQAKIDNKTKSRSLLATIYIQTVSQVKT
jgi:hypothetical protein